MLNAVMVLRWRTLANAQGTFCRKAGRGGRRHEHLAVSSAKTRNDRLDTSSIANIESATATIRSIAEHHDHMSSSRRGRRRSAENEGKIVCLCLCSVSSANNPVWEPFQLRHKRAK